MMFAGYILVFVVTFFGRTITADNIIVFTIRRDGGPYYCISSNASLVVYKGDPININVIGPYFELTDVACSLENSNEKFLNTNDFENRKSSRPQGHANAQITKTTSAHHGKWNCTFTTHMDVDQFDHRSQKKIYAITTCNVQVEIKENATVVVDNKEKKNDTNNATVNDNVNHDTKNIPDNAMNNDLYYIIGGVVGGVVVLVIIVTQTAVICHFKKKMSSVQRMPRLERPSERRDDTARYSTMPGERKRSRKNKGESCIYESLENISAAFKPPTQPNIKERPAMPLPVDDDEHIYDDGETLSRMFTPFPPPIETLPRNSGQKKAAKTKPLLKLKSSKPVTEDYDYPDTMELIQTKDSMTRQKKNPLPIPPKPDKNKPELPAPAPGISAKPMLMGKPGVNPMMNELGNILKKKKASTQAAPAEPGFPRQPMHPNMKSPDMQAKNVRTRPIATSAMRPEMQHSPATRPDMQHSPAMRPDMQHPPAMRPDVQNLPAIRRDVQHPPAMRPHMQTLPATRPDMQHSPAMRPEIQPLPATRPDMQPLPVRPMKPLNRAASQDQLATASGPPTGFRVPQVIKSPPVMKAYPMVRSPETRSPILEQQAHHQVSERQIINKRAPPVPAPHTAEQYDPDHAIEASSDEEWTYEPLPNYHIYNM